MNQFKAISILAILFALLLSCKDNQKSNLTLLSDQIPTDKPLVFGAGSISTPGAKEFAITFNPEMTEMFFTRRKPDEDNEIFSTAFVDGQWTKPELAFFSAETGWDFEPHINPGGDLLYFGTTRPLNDTIEASGMHQWVSKMGEGGWSKPLPLENPFVERVTMYITSSSNDNAYFTSWEEDEKPEDGGIYIAKANNGIYNNVEKLGEEINFEGKWIAHSYIAPDESYMIYDGEGDAGYGDCDLYISFNKNGNWTKAINLGPEINTELCEMCASVSPDGKYLFFHRAAPEGEDESGNIYWVDFEMLRQRLNS